MTTDRIFAMPKVAEPAEQIAAIIDLALAEDIGDGDITSLATVPMDRLFRGRLVAKAPGTAAGLAIARQVFQRVDPTVELIPFV